MTHNNFEVILHDLVQNVASCLEIECIKALEKTTEDERDRVTAGGHWNRLPKVIMLALVENGLIDNQFGAEAITKDVKRFRKILRRA